MYYNTLCTVQVDRQEVRQKGPKYVSIICTMLHYMCLPLWKKPTIKIFHLFMLNYYNQLGIYCSFSAVLSKYITIITAKKKFTKILAEVKSS